MPWRALRSRPVIVEMADVRLTASPRGEAAWEEGPARRRALAAKQAQLAAAELERLAKAGAQVHRGSVHLTAWPTLVTLLC